MSIEAIHINIWDDYHDDGFAPEGESQETYAYVEGGDLAEDDHRAVLLQIQQAIESVKYPDSKLVCSIKWNDSTETYPNLVGTEHEWCLFKRWELQMKHLPHGEREHLVEVLADCQLQYNGAPVVVYSES